MFEHITLRQLQGLEVRASETRAHAVIVQLREKIMDQEKMPFMLIKMMLIMTIRVVIFDSDGEGRDQAKKACDHRGIWASPGGFQIRPLTTVCRQTESVEEEEEEFFMIRMRRIRTEKRMMRRTKVNQLKSF